MVQARAGPVRFPLAKPARPAHRTGLRPSPEPTGGLVDLRALAELIELSLVGLSALVIALGFSVRVFLAPVIREAVDRFSSHPLGAPRDTAARLDRLDDRLAALERGVDRIVAAQDFDRRLSAPAHREPAAD